MSLEIRFQADDFFNAYRVLSENNDAFFRHDFLSKIRLSKKVMGSFPTMAPSIVNLAFAVELYIKDLHFAHAGLVPRGHNIFRLYRKLPKKIKRQIFFHDSIINRPFATNAPIYLLKRFSGERRNYWGFLHQIKVISDGFEKWRYSYESTTLRYVEGFALVFISAVKSAAFRLRTERDIFI